MIFTDLCLGLPLRTSCDGRFRKVETEDKVQERSSRVFPRIDPAVICLVTQGEYCLLGRKPSWHNPTRSKISYFPSYFFHLGTLVLQASLKSERPLNKQSNEKCSKNLELEFV